MVLNILTLLGAVCLFLYGFSLTCTQLLKFSHNGASVAALLKDANPMKAIGIGCGYTAKILSSKEMTVIIVSLVNAGILTLSQSIPAIMGANIGTTVTAWLITVLMFGVKSITVCAYVVMGIGFIMNAGKTRRIRNLGQLLIGIALIFIGLLFVQKTIGTIGTTSSALPVRLSEWSASGYGATLLFALAAMLLSLLFQSSSAAISLTLILLFAGWISFEAGVSMVIGANVGTTLSTSLIARKGSSQALRAALIRVIFNVLTAIVALIFFRAFTQLCGFIIGLFGANPTEVCEPGTTAPLFGLCLSHTLFNLIGSLILVWFTRPMTKVVTAIIPDEEEEANKYRLKYITNGHIGTPALSLSQALKECENFASVCHESFGYVRKAVAETDADKFEEERTKLVEYEELTDRMELAVAAYINELGNNDLTEEETAESRCILRIIGELESLGDGGENISRLLERRRLHGITFDEVEESKLRRLLDKVDVAFNVMLTNMRKAIEGSLADIANAYKAEDEINETRDSLREWAIDSLDERRGNYQSVSYFLDLIEVLESMGDFMINVSQSLIHEK